MPSDEGPQSIPHHAAAFIGTSSEAELGCMLEAACKVFDVPLALVTLGNHRAVWFEASTGIGSSALEGSDASWMPSAVPNRMLVIDDTSLDRRFDGKRTGPGGPPIQFYAGMPVGLRPDVQIGTFCLIDMKPRRLRADQQHLFAEMSKVLAALLRDAPSAQIVDRLADDLAEKARLLRDQYASVTRYKKMYDRSSALARIGVWECNLANEELTWTDGVYDIFELPRGSAVSRAMILNLYYKDSLKEMERQRRKAIRECGSFSLDIRIRTAMGNSRWVRLSADVECEGGVPARIFGLKQDITQEKELWERTRNLAENDPLTGVANRGAFEARLLRALEAKPGPQALAALVLIDLDGFKTINDTLGHSAGDECLRQIAGRLRRFYKGASLVARIGGDEFAALVCGSMSRIRIENDVRRMLVELRHPVAWRGHSFNVGASIGIAIPDRSRSCDASQLFTEADSALYAAKKAGRNTFKTFASELDCAVGARLIA